MSPRLASPHDRKIWGWAMYDFANSGYTTVVLTAVYNAYFVGVVAAHLGTGRATLLWTLALGASNALVIVSAPIIGAIADAHSSKKRFLAASTLICVLATALLGLTGAGTLKAAILLIAVSNWAFATGENLIAAFLPEIAPEGRMGRVSAFGWSLGYLGGLTILGICLGAIEAARHLGGEAIPAVPLAMSLVALCYGLAALPTFLWVPEPKQRREGGGFARLRRTWKELGSFRDLRWLLATVFAYGCGSFSVIVLAAVYANQVFGFETRETMGLMLVLNVAAAAGAYGFGQLQDRKGSVYALALSLMLWVISLAIAYAAQTKPSFWGAALGVGLALGGSQTVGRALFGLMTPPGRVAEFYGLWGTTLRLAAVLGPVSYGAIAEATGGNLRLGLLSTVAFFLAALGLSLRIDEQRGRRRAALG